MHTTRFDCCLLLLTACLASSFTGTNISHSVKVAASDSAFRSWYYTANGVFGRRLLSKTEHRTYYKIVTTRKQSVSVLEYNPVGVLILTTVIQFLNGKISLVTETNQWGDPYDSLWFKPEETGEYIVTERNHGLNPYLPAHAARFTFKNNLLAEKLYLLDSTKPCYGPDGVSHVVYERYSDPERFGLVKSESFFGDINNSVVSRITGCHTIVNEYNENGNLVSRSFYGIQDEPVADQLGNFKTKMSYDKNDHVTEVAYYDVNGKPGNQKLGYARLVKEYKDGLMETETCYNSENRIVRPLMLAEAAAVTKRQYNYNGQELERSFFDIGGYAINNLRGIHQTRYVYNSYGMLTDISYFNNSGLATADISGVHKIHYDRDSRGRITRKKIWDMLDQPEKDVAEGVFETRYSYDNQGRNTEISYWLNDSVKMKCRAGYQQELLGYDNDGRLVWMKYFNEDGSASSGHKGYSRQVLGYNEQALLGSRSYFDGEKPVTLADSNNFASNYHQLVYNYDFNNRVRSIEYFDAFGKPVNAQIRLDYGEPLHSQKVEFTYDDAFLKSEGFYEVSDKDVPLVVDCAKRNCLLSSGLGIYGKSSARVFPRILRERNILPENRDSLFADQLYFLNRDSVLIFLNDDASKLSEQTCAGLYRVTRINKYYQLEGEVTDYFTVNDSVAARLKYSDGRLEGDCSFYYSNGKIKEVGTYKKGKRSGLWLYNYENGRENKKVNFSDTGFRLLEFYNADGVIQVQNGNGRFEGQVVTGNYFNPIPATMSGNIRNGLMDGEWKIYYYQLASPSNIENFENGKFLKGLSISVGLGQKEYHDRVMSSFESVHPGELLDHYDPNYSCSIAGKTVISSAQGLSAMTSDLFNEINDGMKRILASSKYSKYSGWVFLELGCDENGKIVKRLVRLYDPNPDFEKQIMEMLGRMKGGTPFVINNKKTGFEKFYVLLVEANEMVIPEQSLAKLKRSLMGLR